MKTSSLGVSMLLGAFAVQGTAHATSEGITRLSSDALARAWTDESFRIALKYRPEIALRQDSPTQVHFDSDQSINIAISKARDAGDSNVSGDVPRLTTLLSAVGYSGFDDQTRRFLEKVVFGKASIAENTLKGVPSVVPLGSSGVSLAIHQDDSYIHYTVPRNPIDIEHALSIERHAVKVASSTTCCGSGTCDSLELEDSTDGTLVCG